MLLGVVWKGMGAFWVGIKRDDAREEQMEC